MVLKDWNKQKYTRRGIDVFYKINSGRVITIKNIKIVYNLPLQYEVQNRNKLEYIETKYFKTKKQALAYAKAYMRKH